MTSFCVLWDFSGKGDCKFTNFVLKQFPFYLVSLLWSVCLTVFLSNILFLVWFRGKCFESRRENIMPMLLLTLLEKGGYKRYKPISDLLTMNVSLFKMNEPTSSHTSAPSRYITICINENILNFIIFSHNRKTLSTK